ncbi:hypothetical protein PIB30_014581 [Stylosanthes scabra]|uniref:PB1-like domain-containing protein n=1 Tax=Stylosanthes scabra TaxID=79078 RepID=A0ABU6Q6Q9_9FABA|nr:hypothetical protein [Stylosanthes scabra]
MKGVANSFFPYKTLIPLPKLHNALKLKHRSVPSKETETSSQSHRPRRGSSDRRSSCSVAARAVVHCYRCFVVAERVYLGYLLIFSGFVFVILQMATIYVVPVFNVGGNLVRNEAGVIVYEGGKVEKLEEIDIDHVNFGDLEKLLETLGFMSYKKMYWLDSTAFDFETGLNLLDGDDSICDMCQYIMGNIGASNEFHIYVQHSVDVPIPARAPDPAPAPPSMDTPELVIDLEESFDDDGY